MANAAAAFVAMFLPRRIPWARMLPGACSNVLWLGKNRQV